MRGRSQVRSLHQLRSFSLHDHECNRQLRRRFRRRQRNHVVKRVRGTQHLHQNPAQTFHFKHHSGSTLQSCAGPLADCEEVSHRVRIAEVEAFVVWCLMSLNALLLTARCHVTVTDSSRSNLVAIGLILVHIST